MCAVVSAANAVSFEVEQALMLKQDYEPNICDDFMIV